MTAPRSTRCPRARIGRCGYTLIHMLILIVLVGVGMLLASKGFVGVLSFHSGNERALRARTVWGSVLRRIEADAWAARSIRVPAPPADGSSVAILQLPEHAVRWVISADGSSVRREEPGDGPSAGPERRRWTLPATPLRFDSDDRGLLLVRDAARPDAPPLAFISQVRRLNALQPEFDEETTP